MDSDTQTRMFYPAPDRGARRVRGPEQVIVHPDGRKTKRRLYVRTTKVMAFATGVALRAHEHTFEATYAAMLAEIQ